MNDNRLQFLHVDEVFSTKDIAIETLEENLHYYDEVQSLYAEPLVLKYGDEENPNIILAIGSITTGDNDSEGKFFYIDTADIQSSISDIQKELGQDTEKIAELANTLADFQKRYTNDKAKFEEIISNLDAKVDKTKSDLETADAKIIEAMLAKEKEIKEIIDALRVAALFKVENTDSISLEKAENEDGSYTLTAKLRMPSDKKIDDRYISNQLEVINSESVDEESYKGLFYNVALTCNKDDNTLALNVNGNKLDDVELPEGQYVTQGEYNKETETLVFKNKQNNVLFEVGVRNLIEEWDVELENRQKEGVLLELVKDAEYTEESRRNHDNFQDILKAKIIISPADGNIAQINREDGGLYVSNDTKNFMYNNQPLNDFLKTLSPAENIVDEFGYDDKREVFWIKLVGATTNRVEIPISEFFTEYIPDNVKHSVNIAFNRNVNGNSLISADVVIDKDDSYNILSENSNKQLKVVATADKVKYENTTVQDVLKYLQDSVTNLTTKTTVATNKADDVNTRVGKMCTAIGLNSDGTANTYSILEGVRYVRGKVIRDDIKTLDNTLYELDRTVTSNKISTDADIAALKLKDTAIDAAASVLDKKVDDLSSANDSKHSQIDDKLDNLESKVTTNKSEYDLFVQNTNNSIATLNDHKTSYEGKVDTLAQQFNKHKDTFEPKVSKLVIDVDKAEDDIVKLNDYVTEHKTAYDNLIAKVNTKVSATPKTDGYIHLNIDDNKNITITESSDIASKAAFNELRDTVNAMPVYTFESSNTVETLSNENKVISKVKISSKAGNIIEGLGDGIFTAAPYFNYNEANHTITYGDATYTLNTGSIIDEMTFDKASGDIVIKYTKPNKEQSIMRFNATQMFKALNVVNAKNGITLTLTNTDNGGHALSAVIDIANNENNMLTLLGGELFVSDSRVKQVEDNLNNLAKITTGKGDTSVTVLSTTVKEQGQHIATLEDKVGDVTKGLMKNVSDNTNEIDTLKATVNGAEGNIGLSAKMNTAESNINTLNDRVGNLETSVGTDDTSGLRLRMSTAENSISDNKRNIESLQTLVSDIDNGLAKRLVNVENSSSKNKTDIATLVGRVNGHDTSIGDINTTIATLATKTEVSTNHYTKTESDNKFALASALQSLRSEFDSTKTSLETSMDNLRSDLTEALKSHKDYAKEKFDAIERRLDTLSDSLARVQTLLGMTREEMVAKTDISDGLTVASDGRVSVKLAPDSEVTRLLTVKPEGIDYVENPVIDCGIS